MTPLDWLTSAMVTLDMPPFSSVRMMSLPMALALSVPPLTVLKVAMPLPALMAFQRSLLEIFGDDRIGKDFGEGVLISLRSFAYWPALPDSTESVRVNCRSSWIFTSFATSSSGAPVLC
jgi:hypothetical protein